MTLRTVLSIILLTLALSIIPIAAHAQDAAGDLYVAETIACPADLIDGIAFDPTSTYVSALGLKGMIDEIEGQTYNCGVVTVPENYDEPAGHTIELFYLKLHSTSQSPAPDPLIYLSGGPGSSATYGFADIPITLSNLNQIRERRDVIAYDQRGTGYSNYLICAPFLSTYGVALDQTTDAEVAATIESLIGDAQARSLLSKAVCPLVYDTLTAVDLAQYNSVAGGQDILHLAQALGYTDGYNLYGTSYGTRLTQFAMRFTPEQIRSVVIDGVDDPSRSNSALTNGKRYEQYQNIFAQCEANPACAAAYPNLSTRFATLLEKLDEDPLLLDPPLVLSAAMHGAQKLEPVLTQIDPHFFVGLAAEVNGQLNGGPAVLVPGIIQALETGDEAWLRSHLGDNTPLPETPGPAPLSLEQDEDAIDFKQAVFEQPLTALLAQAQLAADAAQSGIGAQWISVVLGDLEARLLAGEDQDQLINDLVAWSVLPYQSRSIGVVMDFANESLSAEAAAQANAIAGQMTRNDLRRTLWNIQDIAGRLGGADVRSASSKTMQYAVNCAEDVAFSTIEDTNAYVAQSPYPQLVLLPAKEFELVAFGPCVTYPKPLDASVAQLVTSTIPALVFQQALDIQTPLSWGKVVADGLPNSFFVEWSNMGHIAAGHDYHSCAGDIAAAFLDNPAREPNISCAQSANYQLQFVLPE